MDASLNRPNWQMENLERPTSPSGEGKGDTMQLWFMLKLQKKQCMQEDI